MVILSLIFLLGADEPVETMAKRMLPIYAKDAAEYAITVESAPTKELELKKEPIFEWSNPARNSQYGAVYLWLREGRPAALINVFSGAQPQAGRRIIRHELHALDTEKLMVKRDALNQWKPQAGLDRKILPDASVPAAAVGARLVQMRRLGQEFSGYSIDRDGKRWELRLLPTPLHRYAPAKTGAIDGALFALVSSAGTDPELLLVIEANEADGKLRWEFAYGAVLRLGAALATQEQGSLCLGSGPDEPLCPRSLAPLSHLSRKDRVLGGEAARPASTNPKWARDDPCG